MDKNEFLKLMKKYKWQTKEAAQFLRKSKSCIRAYKAGGLKIPYLVAELVKDIKKVREFNFKNKIDAPKNSA